MMIQGGLFGEVERRAQMSDDGVYRYTLSRLWAPERGKITWIMLNPSTADAMKDDPTIRRCVKFTEAFGAGGMVVVNLCALRATDPDELLKAEDPSGPDNGEWVCRAVHQADKVIAAWGALSRQLTRWSKIVLDLMKEDDIKLWCLGTTKDGQPRHPLYVRGDTKLMPWIF